MKKVIIVRGIAGSGKSSLVEQIVRSIQQIPASYRVHSTDNYHKVTGEYIFKPERLGLYHKLNLEDFISSLKERIHYVICDNTNTCWREVESYVIAAKERGYSVQFEEPNTGWKYNPEICAAKNVHGVPLKVIEKMLNRWESTEELEEKCKSLNI